jgi:type IV pilus assembly protein PilV
MKIKYLNKGITLIEILVTIVILALGMLGLVGLQANSLRYNLGAYQRTQATFLAYDIIDRMRLNQSAAYNGDYNTLYATAQNATDTLAESDLTVWKASLDDTLTDGEGQIDCTTTANVCVVSVRWDELRQGSANKNQDYVEFTTSTRL